MNKNIYIALAVIIVLVAGVLFANSKKEASNTEQNQTEVINDDNENNSQEQTDNTSNPGAKPQENTNTGGNVAVPQTKTVTYTNDGFSPASFSISSGTKVIFKNESTKSMWVASDPHPTHTTFSEFDSKKGIAAGQTYEFNFNKVGTWKYHNHLSAGDGGTITVQ